MTDAARKVTYELDSVARVATLKAQADLMLPMTIAVPFWMLKHIAGEILKGEAIAEREG